MGFVLVILGIWGVAMVAWFMVSKYFKASDIDRVKARLLGTSRAKNAKGKKGELSEKQVIINHTDSKNQFAQAVVEKYQLGPKLANLMEQAGLKWPPGGRGPLTIMTLGSVLAIGWVFLPIPKLVTLAAALVASAGPWVYVF